MVQLGRIYNPLSSELILADPCGARYGQKPVILEDVLAECSKSIRGAFCYLVCAIGSFALDFPTDYTSASCNSNRS